jgi:hypothetical protein
VCVRREDGYIIVLMVRVVLQSRVIPTDDTPVKLQEPVTHHLSAVRRGAYLGDAALPYNVFDFPANHKRDGPHRLLANYQGYLRHDAGSTRRGPGAIARCVRGSES